MRCLRSSRGQGKRSEMHGVAAVYNAEWKGSFRTICAERNREFYAAWDLYISFKRRLQRPHLGKTNDISARWSDRFPPPCYYFLNPFLSVVASSQRLSFIVDWLDEKRRLIEFWNWINSEASRVDFSSVRRGAALGTARPFERLVHRYIVHLKCTSPRFFMLRWIASTFHSLNFEAMRGELCSTVRREAIKNIRNDRFEKGGDLRDSLLYIFTKAIRKK